MTAPGMIVLALLAWGIFTNGRTAILLFFAAASFGTLAILPPAVTGGASILPLPVAALALATWLLRRRGAAQGVVSAAIDPRALGLLTAFVAYGAVSAIVLPRLFAGMDVIAFRQDLVGATPLAPSSANLTQSAYLAISLITALVFDRLVRDVRDRRAIMSAIVIGGVVVVLSGLADMATGGTKILAPLRNASYAVLSGHVILDARRVIGLMPEASSFGPLCITFAALIYFLPSVQPPPLSRLLSLGLVAALMIMGALSMSSTAFFGIVVFTLVAALSQLRQAIVSRRKLRWRTVYAGVVSFSATAFVVALLVLFQSSLVSTVTHFVNTLIFEKAQSSSFADRSMANDLAFDVFAKTRGLGVGVGSMSTSSWVTAVLSNTGFIGAMLMGGLLLLTFARRPTNVVDDGLVTGLKFALLTNLAMAAVAAPAPDFGMLAAAMFGSIAGLSARASAQRLQPVQVRATPVALMREPS